MDGLVPSPWWSHHRAVGNSLPPPAPPKYSAALGVRHGQAGIALLQQDLPDEVPAARAYVPSDFLPIPVKDEGGHLLDVEELHRGAALGPLSHEPPENREFTLAEVLGQRQHCGVDADAPDRIVLGDLDDRECVFESWSSAVTPWCQGGHPARRYRWCQRHLGVR